MENGKEPSRFSDKRFQGMVAVAGFLAFAVGWELLPDLGIDDTSFRPPKINIGMGFTTLHAIHRAPSSERAPDVPEGRLLSEFTSKIGGESITFRNYRKCEFDAPTVKPVAYVKRRSSTEIVLFVDWFSIFDDGAGPATKSVYEVTSGLSNNTSEIMAPPSTVEKMEQRETQHSNCWNLQFSVKINGELLFHQTDDFDIEVLPRMQLTGSIETVKGGKGAKFHQLFWEKGDGRTIWSVEDDPGESDLPEMSEISIFTSRPDPRLEPVVGSQYIIRCPECEQTKDGVLSLFLRVNASGGGDAQQLTILSDGNWDRVHTIVPIRSISSGRYTTTSELPEGFVPTLVDLEQEGFELLSWQDSKAGDRRTVYMAISGLLLSVGLGMMIESLFFFLRRRFASQA